MYALCLIAFLGLCLGSFASVISYRLPRMLPLWTARSMCTDCRRFLSPLQLIPLVSFIGQRGRCGHCHRPISLRYPLLELGSMATSLGIFWQYGLGWQTALLIVLTTLLWIMILIDYEHYIIHDTLVGLAFIGALIYLPLLHIPYFPRLLQSVCITLLMWSIGWAMQYGYRRPMLGGGDLKLFMLAGFVLPYSTLPTYFLLSGLLGCLSAWWWRKTNRGAVFPFAPSLLGALYLCLIYPCAMDIPSYLLRFF